MAWGGLAESCTPHNYGFLLKAEIWQLLLEKREESRRSVDEAGILAAFHMPQSQFLRQSFRKWIPSLSNESISRIVFPY